MQPRIFLSHSSKDAALTEAVSEALKAADANHPGYEVLVDSECLKAGEEWPVQLHAMMAFAHAGLLLLTRAALSRPDWVRNEAYILAWRRSLDPTFKLFYALLDDVKRSELSATGFDPAHLRLLQELHAKDAAGIAAEVKAEGPKGVPAQTPFQELSCKLGAFLKNIDRQGLQAIAQRIEAEAKPVPWLPGEQSQYVESITARVLAGRLGNYQCLSAFINELKGRAVEKESLEVVLRLIAPYWLSPEASGRFSASVRELWLEGTGGNVTINGKYIIAYTARMFVFKTHPFEFQCQVAEIEGPAHNADARHYKQQICEWLRRKMPEDYEGLTDDGVLDLLKQEKPFLFVPLPAPAPDKETLRTLRDWFPRVVFLLWTGARLQDVECDCPVVALIPELDEVREHAEYFDWRQARKAVRG